MFKSTTLMLCMAVSGCSFIDKLGIGDKTGSNNSAGTGKSIGAVETPKVDAAWFSDYETNLQTALTGSSFEITRYENALIVTAPVDSTFNPDRPGMLLPVSLSPITKVAKLLEKDRTTAVMVLGHADSLGSAELNHTLTTNRASAVGAIFSLSGLKSDRLLIKGMGSLMPRSANDSKEGRALNRRVEMVLSPKNVFKVLVTQYRSPAQPIKVISPVSPAVAKTTRVALGESKKTPRQKKK
ncbi:outer membrane protein OmpA-like peptidoglycan-associated protein [Azomonas macrocytogenes]|uniref:Outer membrane protein OmpA-like peptidoglycan-associated protein n=1 Tax=Azomonas macrocytogenes TaxID=69962 RepID=A0A839SY48_AZOMA|nr:outer membrane protein OmpA-like peptidoglycan-associated protein [Azomonas macrocytogenes]